VAILLELRRWLARTKIRRYQQITAGVQASPPGGAYVGVAASALTLDAQRAIVSSDLAKSSLSGGQDVRTDLYDGQYAYVLTNPPEQRLVTLDGYTPRDIASSVTDQTTSPVAVGYLILERNLGSVLPAGTVVELHTHPPLDADGAPGLHTFINQALTAMRGMLRRITISTIPGQQAYSLAAYGITHQWQLGQVLGLSPSGQEPYSARGAARLRNDGGITSLVFAGGAPTVSTFYVELYLPRSAWIKHNGTWSLSTVGLVDDADEATGEVNEVALVAYYHYCQYRMIEADGTVNPTWANLARLAAKAARPFLEHGEDVPIDAWRGPGPELGGWGSDWGLVGPSGGASGGGPSWP
jgi:hypothetical protein